MINKDLELITRLLVNPTNIDYVAAGKNENPFNIKRLLNNQNLTHSNCVRFSKMFENFIKDIIKEMGYETLSQGLINTLDAKILKNSGKGKTDIDICFKINKNIYYFECKTQLSLDSEKAPATDNKIAKVGKYLASKYPDYIINKNLITCWYEAERGINQTMKTNCYFMNDLFKLLGFDISKEEYENILKEFGKMIKN